MPIIAHDACAEPPADTLICRFMPLWKFTDLFANEELYFRRTDLFKETDPREALPSDESVRAALGLQRYDLNDEMKLNEVQASNRQNSEAYFINCWQIYEDETFDMWKTYGEGEGVAVFSRFDLLRATLSVMLDDILVGIVRYGEKDLTKIQHYPVSLHETASSCERARTSCCPSMLRSTCRSQPALRLEQFSAPRAVVSTARMGSRVQTASH